MSILQSRPTLNEHFPLALVTGAAHRLGKMFALRLASQGYAIALHYHHAQQQAAETAEQIRALGVPVFPMQANLREPVEVQALFIGLDGLLNSPELGLTGLKVLVNSAAVMQKGEAATLSMDDFDAVLNLNLRAPFQCAQLAFARMQTGGLIINISDVAAQKTWKAYAAYTISKSGLEALTRILARSFGPRVRVNAISPGLVLPAEDFDPLEWTRLIQRIPAQRGGTLDELGQALEFLLKNEYITGQTIQVDGGYGLI